ncbi:hypothetical protein QOT17_021107 [Balamuthia mandrillaris]
MGDFNARVGRLLSPSGEPKHNYKGAALAKAITASSLHLSCPDPSSTHSPYTRVVHSHHSTIDYVFASLQLRFHTTIWHDSPPPKGRGPAPCPSTRGRNPPRESPCPRDAWHQPPPCSQQPQARTRPHQATTQCLATPSSSKQPSTVKPQASIKPRLPPRAPTIHDPDLASSNSNASTSSTYSLLEQFSSSSISTPSLAQHNTSAPSRLPMDANTHVASPPCLLSPFNRPCPFSHRPAGLCQKSPKPYLPQLLPIEQRFLDERHNGTVALEGLTLCALGPITTYYAVTRLRNHYGDLTHTFEHPCHKKGWQLVGLTFNSAPAAKHVLTHNKTLLPDASVVRWWVGEPRLPAIIAQRRETNKTYTLPAAAISTDEPTTESEDNVTTPAPMQCPLTATNPSNTGAQTNPTYPSTTQQPTAHLPLNLTLPNAVQTRTPLALSYPHPRPPLCLLVA